MRCLTTLNYSRPASGSGPDISLTFPLIGLTHATGWCNVNLCLVDVAVKKALSDSGPLIETRVDLAAGRLTAAEWLQPMATRGGLRIAAR